MHTKYFVLGAQLARHLGAVKGASTDACLSDRTTATGGDEVR